MNICFSNETVASFKDYMFEHLSREGKEGYSFDSSMKFEEKEALLEEKMERWEYLTEIFEEMNS